VPQNKGMKQTSVEHIGRSQLIPGVRPTVGGARGLADRPASQSWWKRAIQSLVARAPLPPFGSLQACAAISGFFALGAVAGLIGGMPLTRVVALQVAVAVLGLGGAAVSWFRERLVRPYMILMGVVLLAWVMWYPGFVLQHLLSRTETGTHRFGHAPGTLALALAFSLRMLLDFGAPAEAQQQWAVKLGVAGLVVGAILDIVVLWAIVTMF